MKTEHQPGCAGFDTVRGQEEGICLSFCWGHERCEPMPEHVYIVCGECMHAFRTEADLVREYVASAPTGWAPPPEGVKAAQIFFCPICIHDF